MVIAETPLTIRYVETDQMGIVHHSNYPIWFEVGRMDFFQKIGASYQGIEAQGILLPLIHMQCNFKHAIRYGEMVLIKTSLTKISNVKIEFSYEIFSSSSNKLLSSGLTVHAWTDKKLKPVILAKVMPKVYELLRLSL